VRQGSGRCTPVGGLQAAALSTARSTMPPPLVPLPLVQVSDVDMRHKVNTFILKNPPENKLSKEEKRWGRQQGRGGKGPDRLRRAAIHDARGVALACGCDRQHRKTRSQLLLAGVGAGHLHGQPRPT
jgi:hypothetical protein